MEWNELKEYLSLVEKIYALEYSGAQMGLALLAFY